MMPHFEAWWYLAQPSGQSAGLAAGGVRPGPTPYCFLLFCLRCLPAQVVGNVMGLANHHSASRVIQWCMKEGSEGDKKKLAAEVRANIVPLSKSKYGRHVVQKLINIAPKEEVPGGLGCGWGLWGVVCVVVGKGGAYACMPRTGHVDAAAL